MIDVYQLTKRYGALYALDNVSFSLQPGTICGIIGHNGAGKTTLLKILAGLVTPTSGQVSMNKIPIQKDPVRIKSHIGYLPEESRLYETMTVPDYLSFFGRLYGLSGDTIQKRENELLSSLSLDHGGKQIGNLSKGMKRKVALARSLIHDPSLLIYDEATSGLDPMTSRFITGYLEDLGSSGKTIILSAHNLFQVERICNLVIILKQGRIVEMGSMDELRERFGTVTYGVLFTEPAANLPEKATRLADRLYRLEVVSIDELNEVTTTLTRSGSEIKRIESVYPTLEEMLVAVGK
ncbi:MAG: ABC transporter ATP-binding protein [Methanospirillaceae archaeon]|nr:ABC transporter ATP-binding protein [Methanospirillaceae archaeon]